MMKKFIMTALLTTASFSFATPATVKFTNSTSYAIAIHYNGINFNLAPYGSCSNSTTANCAICPTPDNFQQLTTDQAVSATCNSITSNYIGPTTTPYSSANYTVTASQNKTSSTLNLAVSYIPET